MNSNCAFIPNYDRYLNISKELVNDPIEFPTVKDDYFKMKAEDEKELLEIYYKNKQIGEAS